MFLLRGIAERESYAVILRAIKSIGQAASIHDRLQIGFGKADFIRSFQQFRLKTIGPFQSGKRIATVHEHAHHFRHVRVRIHLIELLQDRAQKFFRVGMRGAVQHVSSPK